MKTIGKLRTEFKEFCIKIFNSEELGTKVYNFYREMLYGINTKSQTLTEGRTKNLQYLVDTYSTDAIIKSIDKQITAYNSGTIGKGSIHINFFISDVKFAFSDTKQPKETKKVIKDNKQASIPSKNQLQTIIPMIVKRINTNSENPYDDFMYRCPKCQSLIPGYKEECSSCFAIINYEGIILPEN